MSSVGIVSPRDNSELRSTAVDLTIDTEVAELVWNICHGRADINTVTRRRLAAPVGKQQNHYLCEWHLKKRLLIRQAQDTTGRIITCWVMTVIMY